MHLIQDAHLAASRTWTNCVWHVGRFAFILKASHSMALGSLVQFRSHRLLLCFHGQ
jgi:hypothetical protein